MNKLFRFGHGSIKGLRILDAAEVESYHRSIEHLREFNSILGLLRMSKQNHFEFEKEIGAVRADFVIWDGNPPTQREITPRINLRVINLLATVRLYLDHVEFRLSRTYGKESEELRGFERATSTAYERSFAYRFLYKMRNFAQHLGFPISHVGVKSSLVALPALDKSHEFAIVFQPKDLLAQDRQVWGPVAAELEQLEDTVEVGPLIRAMMKEMEQIHLATIEIETPRARAAAAAVDAVLREAMIDGAQGGVGDFEDVPGGGRMTVAVPPANVMGQLGYEGTANSCETASAEEHAVKRTPGRWAPLAVNIMLLPLLFMTCVVMLSGLPGTPGYEPSGVQFIWIPLVAIAYVVMLLLMIGLRRAGAASRRNVQFAGLALVALVPSAIALADASLVVTLVLSVATAVGLLFESWRIARSFTSRADSH